MLDRADIHPAHNEDLPFRAARWGCLATIWAAVLSHCQNCGTRYRSAGYGSGYLRLGVVVDHQRKTVSLLSHNDVNAVGPGWKTSNSPRRKISRLLPLAIQYDPRAVRRKISQSTGNLHSGDCYQVNLAQRFHATYLAMNGRHSFSLIRPTARRLAFFTS